MTKTWIDLLGCDSKNCKVDGRYIVREESPNHFRVLWTSDTPEMSQATFDAWQKEIRQANEPPPGSWAAVARVMAQTTHDEDLPDDFWDNWKDEMKERDFN